MLVGMIVIVFVAFSLRLMNYQIVQADEYHQGLNPVLLPPMILVLYEI